ncbi:MAG: hypothetical protein ACYTG0_32170 [Planctomycetota bacterium]|jgi:hypothetical protein
MQTDVLQVPAAGGTDADAMTAADWRRWHRTLSRLRKEPKLTPSAYQAFAWLWLRVGAQVTRSHKLYLPELAAELGKGLRTAERWIERLQVLGLVVIKDRSTIGWWTIDINYRCPEVESGADDPQLELPFMAGGNSVDNFGAKADVKVGAKVDVKVVDNFGAKPATELSQENLSRIGQQAAAGELSMGEAFRAMVGPRKPTQRAPPVPKRHENRFDIDIRNRKEIDIGVKTHEGIQNAIFQRLADPALHMAPVAKVAALVFADARSREHGQPYEGGKHKREPLTWVDVQRAIDYARQSFRDGNTDAPWIYFVGAMQRAFAERGLRWSHGKRRSPR